MMLYIHTPTCLHDTHKDTFTSYVLQNSSSAWSIYHSVMFSILFRVSSGYFGAQWENGGSTCMYFEQTVHIQQWKNLQTKYVRLRPEIQPAFSRLQKQ